MIVIGERVALGPLREDLVPVYARWMTTLEVARGLGNTTIFTVLGLHNVDLVVFAWNKPALTDLVPE